MAKKSRALTKSMSFVFSDPNMGCRSPAKGLRSVKARVTLAAQCAKLLPASHGSKIGDILANVRQVLEKNLSSICKLMK